MKKQLPLFVILSFFIPFAAFSQLTFKKLTGTDPTSNGRVAGDQFGFSVAVSGTIAVVGAPFHDYDALGGDSMDKAGAAYIFYRNEGGNGNWGLIKKIVPTGTNARDTGDNFGNAVAIDGDVIVVGAILHDFDANGLNEQADAGVVYVFYKDEGGADNWGQKQKLVGKGNNGRVAEDNFGKAVGISGGIIVVGAYQQDYDAPGVGFSNFGGAAYIYYKDEGGTDNWGQKQKIIGRGNNGRRAGDFFGTSVAIEGDIVAVGANLQDWDNNGNNEQKDAGAVFIYYKDELGADNWGLKQRVVGSGANGRTENDNFGISLALSGNNIIVGAHLQDFDANGAGSVNAAGAAYVFNKNEGGADNWGLVKKLTGSGTNSRTVGDNFGISVAITGDIVVVGSGQQDYSAVGDSLATAAGAIFIFYQNEGGTNNWGLKEKLVGSGINGRNDNDIFGNTVATSADVILVGAFGQDYDENGANLFSDAGAAFAFNYDRVNPTSINEQTKEQNIFVSSLNKEVHIGFANEGDYTISIYDIMGREVYTGITETSSSTIENINLEGVAAGYYIVNISQHKTKQTFKVLLK